MKCPLCQSELPGEHLTGPCPVCGQKLVETPKIPESGHPINTTSNAGLGALWLVVGLLPIPILLLTMGSNSSKNGAPFILILCCLLNLVGGIGCLSSVKNPVVRVCCGLLLAGLFFVLSCAIVLFQACSHMNI